MTTVVERIDERIALLGTSRRAACLAAGLGADAIRDMERKDNLSPTLRTLEKLAPVLQTTVEWLRAGDAEVVESQERELPSGFKAPPEFLGERDLPVYASVEGGDGEMVVTTDPIDYVVRPWFLREYREGYAVLVTGSSMEPEFESGDMAIVNPSLPIARGKNVILVRDESLGEFKASIKRLVSWTAKTWTLRQHNPPEGQDKDFTLSRREWPKALRVVGKYDGY